MDQPVRSERDADAAHLPLAVEQVRGRLFAAGVASVIFGVERERLQVERAAAELRGEGEKTGQIHDTRIDDDFGAHIVVRDRGNDGQGVGGRELRGGAGESGGIGHDT